MPNDLGPERLTLRQADQAREDFAQILDELDFLRSQIARLPTKSEVRWMLDSLCNKVKPIGRCVPAHSLAQRRADRTGP